MPRHDMPSLTGIQHMHSATSHARRGVRATRATRVTPGLTAGFTLIELLVVIIVLGLLAALVGPRILGRVSEAKTATARTQIELLGTALDNYRLDTGSYPTTEQGLDALNKVPTREPIPLNWHGPYVKRDVPNDPWTRPYVYKSPG